MILSFSIRTLRRLGNTEVATNELIYVYTVMHAEYKIEAGIRTCPTTSIEPSFRGVSRGTKSDLSSTREASVRNISICTNFSVIFIQHSPPRKAGLSRPLFITDSLVLRRIHDPWSVNRPTYTTHESSNFP